MRDAPLKWPGGKHYLANRIVSLMPPHLHYVEPFAGGLAVLLARDPEGISEVVNDLNGDLAHFWQVLADETAFGQMQRILEATPFSEEHWHLAHHWRSLRKNLGALDPEAAAAFFVNVRQSMVGRMKAFAPLSRNRVRRGMNEQASAWLSAVQGLPEVHARLRRVVVLNRDALEVIQGQDGSQTLFYCDPPYLHETRSTTTEYGSYEMSPEQHRELLQVLLGCQGKVLLSGYRSGLYDEMLAGWVRHDFDLPNNAASGSSKRRMVECVWCNFRGAV